MQGGQGEQGGQKGCEGSASEGGSRRMVTQGTCGGGTGKESKGREGNECGEAEGYILSRSGLWRSTIVLRHAWEGGRKDSEDCVGKLAMGAKGTIEGTTEGFQLAALALAGAADIFASQSSPPLPCVAHAKLWIHCFCCFKWVRPAHLA